MWLRLPLQTFEMKFTFTRISYVCLSVERCSTCNDKNIFTSLWRMLLGHKFISWNFLHAKDLELCFSYFLTLKRRKQTSINKVSMIFILNDVHQYCRENWASLQLLFWFSKVRKVSDIKRNEKLSGARFLTFLKRGGYTNKHILQPFHKLTTKRVPFIPVPKWTKDFIEASRNFDFRA